jgi:hypothetical protein
MHFTDLFIRRPVLSLVVSLLILLIGARAMYGLQIRQYPKLSNTTITVTTVYPGASPDLIEGFITTPIEQAVATSDGIDYLTSNSVQGTSTITAYIKLNYDPSKALTDVIAKVQQVKYLMPTAAQDPIIIKATGQTTAVMYIGFASPTLQSAGISDYLTRVVQPLMAPRPTFSAGKPSRCGCGSTRCAWRRATSPQTTSRGRSRPIISNLRQVRPRAPIPSPTLTPGPGLPMSINSSAWSSNRMAARSCGWRTSPTSSSPRKAGIRASR